jgi:CBS domain-containing protein
MILKELMREDMEVVTLTCEARICDAAHMMKEKRIGSIIIVDGDIVDGIITDRDIALGLALGVATPNSYVAEVMSREVETIENTMSLFDVSRHFRNCCHKRLPVVDKQKRLVGLVSIDDIMALLSREMFDTCSALEPKLGHMV